MKKALCLLIGLSLFAAQAFALEVSAPDTFPIVAEKVTLKMWTPQSPIVEDYGTNKLAVWFEEKSNVHIDWITVPNAEMGTQLNLSLASGDYPDVYLCNLTTDLVLLCANNGIILPLEGLIAEHAPWTSQRFAENPQYLQYLTAPDGHLYTLYYSDIGVHMFSTYKMFVYQPWLDQLGLDVPQTTEAFKQMLVAFRDNDMNGNGDPNDEIPYTSSFAASSGSPFYYLINPFQLASQNGVIRHADGSVTASFNTDGYREGLTYIRDLYREGLVDEALFVQDNTQLRALINIAEKDRFLVGAFTNFARQMIIDQSVMPYYVYTAVPPLEGPSGLRQTATNGYGSFTPRCAITTACKTPEVAVKWLDYWMGDEGTMTQSFGWEEGVDYERGNQPNYLGTDDTWNWLFDSTSMQNTILLNLGLPRNDTPYRRYSTPATYEATPMRLWEAALAYEPYYVNTGIPALVWNTDESLSEELSILRPMIDDYVQRASAEFVLGTRSLEDDWEAYRSELENMGLARYLEILTKLYE